ncbi:MAG: DUF4476 domain-containing protein [Saprospiraceae bacterium]|nr:DUF4476 domain-containing protein [Saprospiraceae bacterium]
MRPISNIITAFLMLIFAVSTALAQGNPYGDSHHKSTDNNNRNRPHRHCTSAYANKLFNRDYASLGNSNMYHLDNELRSYIKYRCLTSEQIRRLAVLFQTDREKYDFLVYGLNYVYDIENYAMTGSVLANRNARDGFYRFLVKEGVPAGDYYNDYYANAAYYTPPPVYVQQRPVDNTYNNYPDPRYNNQNQTPQYPQQNGQYPPQNGQYVQQPPQYGGPQYARSDNDMPDINSKGLNSGYKGLMTYKEFDIMKDRVKQNTLEAGKVETAKAMTKENVLTAIQVAEIARLFTFDNNRLDFAKFAFDFTYDRENYTVVSDALVFQKNREDLHQFVQSQKR